VSVTRQGTKVPRPTLVLYALASEQARFGLIVGKKVGNAVKRNHVKRQLRHTAMSLIDETRPLNVIARALPRAAYRDPGEDLRSAWAEAVEKVRP